MKTRVHVRFVRGERWRHLRIFEQTGTGFSLQITPCRLPSRCSRCQAKLGHVKHKLKRVSGAQIVRRRLGDRTNHFLIAHTKMDPVEYLRRRFGLVVVK